MWSLINAHTNKWIFIFIPQNCIKITETVTETLPAKGLVFKDYFSYLKWNQQLMKMIFLTAGCVNILKLLKPIFVPTLNGLRLKLQMKQRSSAKLCRVNTKLQYSNMLVLNDCCMLSYKLIPLKSEKIINQREYCNHLGVLS